MAKITLYESATPGAAPPAGTVYLYPKADGRWYFMSDDGIELPMRPVGAGTGDLLSDGTVPLTANWDVGAFSITALRFHSDEPTLSPFTVVSNAVVTNLNADTVDGFHASAFLTPGDVGTAAAEDVGYFATAAQGALADTAVQPADIGTAAAEDVGYFATAAQGALADTALQDEDVTKYIGQNLQTGTTYTLVLGDAGKIIEMNNGAANTLTIPANASVAFPVNTRIDVVQYGAGQTTIAITSDTLRGAPKIQAQYKMVSLWKRAATEWVVVGGTT